MVQYIPVRDSEPAIVDDEDFEQLSQFQWDLNDGGYPRAWTGQRQELMHHIVLPKTLSTVNDHINGNRLDNRRGNLRRITQQQNSVNAKLRKDNKSGFRGVHRDEYGRKWIAAIQVNGKKVCIGTFISAEEAARAYDERALIEFGPYVRLNFPEGIAS